MCGEKERNKGFSLVELLVCIVILAIISFPLLNSFLVAGKTNEKAKAIQRTTTLAQNIMETVKSQSFDDLKLLFTSSNLQKLNLNAPYDITNSTITMQEDSVNGRYEYCIRRVKDGIEEYDVYITLDSAPYKVAAGNTQNNYQMPQITNLKGNKIAVIDPEGCFANWNSYVDAQGNTLYTKDTSSNIDSMIVTYFYNLHLAYMDYLTMQGQETAESIPSYYPYSYEQIRSFIKKETTIVARNETKPDGSFDESAVDVTGKIEYSIAGTYKVTGELSGLHSEYQVFSKTFKEADGTNPLEKIYLFYSKSDLLENIVVAQNDSINRAELTIVGQTADTLKVKCLDTMNLWTFSANVPIVFLQGMKSVTSELVSSEEARNRLYEVKVEVYQSDVRERMGTKYVELLSSKGE